MRCCNWLYITVHQFWRKKLLIFRCIRLVILVIKTFYLFECNGWRLFLGSGFNPIQNGLFRGCSRMERGWEQKGLRFYKICHTYPTMMKLGSYTLPKEDPKNIWIPWHTPFVLLTSAFFHSKSANFALSRNTAKNCILLHNF